MSPNSVKRTIGEIEARGGGPVNIRGILTLLLWRSLSQASRKNRQRKSVPKFTSVIVCRTHKPLFPAVLCILFASLPNYLLLLRGPFCSSCRWLLPHRIMKIHKLKIKIGEASCWSMKENYFFVDSFILWKLPKHRLCYKLGHV